ncbi:MAG: CBS domain-containing protein [Anaerolineales bacterium]|jgi:magnesium transporter
MATLNPIFRKFATDQKVTLFKQGRARILADCHANTAALMKTQYTALRPNLAAADAIKTLHRVADQNAGILGAMFYVYVTDEDGHLLGVFSLSDLISAHPGTLVREFMKTCVVSVKPGVDVRTIARTVAEFNLLEVPVVDDQNRLQGIITADDALDFILPHFWKEKLPRFTR